MIDIRHDTALRRETPPAAQPDRRYGALPWRQNKRGEVRLLLIAPRRGGRWTVPEVVPDSGRAPYLSASLGAFEQAGVIGEIRPAPVAEYRRGDDAGASADGILRMKLFSLRIRGTLTNWPQRAGWVRQWFGFAEAAAAVADPGLAETIRALGGEPARLTQIDRIAAAAGAHAASESAVEMAAAAAKDPPAP